MRLAIKLVFIIVFGSTYSSAGSKLQRVNLQLQWLDQFQFAGYYIAKEKGFYKDVGLDVKLLKFNNSVSSVDMVLSHEATYGIGRSNLIIEKSKGKEIVLLASIFQSSPSVFIARKDSNIKTIKDFIGKRIMITNDVVATVDITAMMSKKGVSSGKIIKQKHSFDIDDLINRKTDLMASYLSNEPFLLKQKGVQYTIFDPKDYGFDFYSDILFTSQYEIDNHQQRTDDFRRASLKGWEYAFEHIDETVNIILEKYNTQHKSKEALLFEANVLKKLAYGDSHELGHISVDKIERIYDFYNVMNLLENKVAFNEFIYEEGQKKIRFSKEEKEYIQNKKSITMCVHPNFGVFENINNKGKMSGISIDFVRLAAQNSGISLKLIKTSGPKEAMLFLKEKKCDLRTLYNQSQEQKEGFILTDTFLSDPNVVVARIDHPYVINLKTIKNDFIALQKGSIIYTRLSKEKPLLKIIPVNSEHDAILMVTNKKADMTLQSLATAVYNIRKHDLINLKIAGQVEGYNNKLSLSVLKEHKILRDILNKGIHDISEEERDEIMNKYTAVMVQKQNDNKIFRWFGSFILVLISVITVVMAWNAMLRKKIKQETAKTLAVEEKLFQKSKKAEIGNLVANISHQWREPLSKLSSMNLLNIAKIKHGEIIDSDWLLKHSFEIEKVIDFMSVTMQNFLEFYKENSDKKDFSLQASLKGCFSILETKLIDNDISITITGDDTILYGIKSEWMQIWLNLLNNSIQIFLERKIANPFILVEFGLKEVVFCDNGGGFETTSEHSGLGHKMCAKIVNKYGAHMELNNNELGACVRIILPTD